MRTLICSLLITALTMVFSFGEAAVAQDVVLAIPFDEGQGEVAKDLSSYQNNGTLKSEGTIEWAAGKFGQAVKMDGDDWVDAGDDPSLDLSTGDFTIAAWLNFGAEGHLAIASADEGSGETNKWFFGVRYSWFAEGDLTLHINSPDMTGVWVASKSWSGDTEKWYQIALVKKGNKYSFYVDGKVVETVENDVKIPAAATPLTIGWAEEDVYFDGLMDEFLIIKRALSEEEIINHFEGGLTGFLAVEPVGKLTTTWGNIKTEILR